MHFALSIFSLNHRSPRSPSKLSSHLLASSSSGHFSPRFAGSVEMSWFSARESLSKMVLFPRNSFPEKVDSKFARFLEASDEKRLQFRSSSSSSKASATKSSPVSKLEHLHFTNYDYQISKLRAFPLPLCVLMARLRLSLSYFQFPAFE